MTQNTLSQLKMYINDCYKLRNTIQCLIRDLRFANSGGTIIYAVDFSEIFSYLIPNQPSDEFLFLGDYNIEDAILIQRSVLYHFFHRSHSKHILLTPYVLELEGFLAKLKDGAYSGFIIQCLNIYGEIEKISKSTPFTKMYEIINRGKDLNEKEIERVFTFMKNYAPNLMNMLTPPWEAPYKLLRELFESEVFQNAVDIGVSQKDILPNKEVFDKWTKELVLERGASRLASSILDAEAVSIVDTLNADLSDRKTKVYLVTRSKYMHNIMANEMSEKYKNADSDDCGYLLRNPISFYFQYGLNNRKRDELISELVNELNSIEFFLELVENSNLDKEFTSLEQNKQLSEIRKHLSEITKTWKTSNLLEATTYGFTHETINQTQLGELFKEVGNFFNFIRDSEKVRVYITDRLIELHEKLRREHQYLGLYTQLQQIKLDATIEINRYPGKFVLKTIQTNRQSVPYTFQFYSEDAGNLLEGFGDKGRYSLDDVMPMFIEGFRQDTNYERLLAMAFVLSTLGKWEEAEKFCEEAINEKYIRPNIFPHEGYFFLAICKRKFNFTVERCKKALILLEKATSTKREQKKEQAYEDPRYIHEKGVQIIKCWFQFADKIKSGKNIPHIETGIDAIRHALEIIDADDYLRIQALNNILFYNIHTGLYKDDIEKSKEILSELISRQNLIESDYKLWPGAILDTVGLGKWKLFGVKSKQDFREVNILFQAALDDRHLEKSERKSIEVNYQEFLAETSAFTAIT